MKKLAIAITAVVFLLAGCQSDVLQVEEMTREQAPEVNLKSAKNRPALNCVNVRDQQVFYLGPVNISFSEYQELFLALEKAGAFDDHQKYGELIAWVNFENYSVMGLGAPFGEEYIFEHEFEGMKVASIVTHQYTARNGATFFRLFHLFYIDPGDSSEIDAFVTMDEAVATPFNSEMVGRINNKLEIIAGTGIFAEVSGSIINNGIVQYFDHPDFGIIPVILDAKLHGRICF